MTIERRDFLRMAGAVATGPWLAGAAACGGGESAGTAGAAGTADAVGAADAAGPPGAVWSGYSDRVIVDALSGPIQFNIPQESLPLGDAALEHVRQAGITAVNLTVNARPGEGESAYESASAKMAEWVIETETHPELLSIVRTVADVRDAKSAGRLGLVFGFQDALPFEDDLGRLAEFHDGGLRIVQLTYNVVNRVGVGCLAPDDTGLTTLGHEAVERMDDLGILVDLSHCGPQTTLDGIRASRGPVSVTHSGCKTVFAHPRSKDDESLRLLADRGGVVGVYLMPFLNASGPPSADDVIAHIEYALDVCGEDHVGIGSDQGIAPLDVTGDFPAMFDVVSAQRAAAGIAAPREDTIPYVPDLNHPRRLETIGTMLAARGHTASVIDKVLGLNFMRLFEEVWT